MTTEAGAAKTKTKTKTKTKAKKKPKKATKLKKQAALTAAAAAHPEPTDAQVEAVALQVRQVSDQAGLQVAVAVGKLILDSFFGGDLEALRSRDPGKDTSLRRLAAHPDVPYGVVTLSRFVGIFELTERLGGVSRWKHLTPSHWRTIVSLPEKVQEQLVRKAEDERWTAEQLENAARKYRKAGGGGRPALPLAARGLGAVAGVFKRNFDALGEVDDLQGLKPERARDLLQTLAALEAWLPGAKRALGVAAQAPIPVTASSKPAKAKKATAAPGKKAPAPRKKKPSARKTTTPSADGAGVSPPVPDPSADAVPEIPASAKSKKDGKAKPKAATAKRKKRGKADGKAKRGWLRPKEALPIVERLKAALDGGEKLDAIATTESMSPATLRRWLFLAELPEEAKAKVRKGEVKGYKEAMDLAAGG